MNKQPVNVDVLLFSRDRAMQLDGVLRSFFLHCKDVDGIRISVLYLATDERHDRQYRSLVTSYPNVIFVPQRNFRRDLLRILNPYKNREPPGNIYSVLGAIGNLGFAMGSVPDRIWNRAAGYVQRLLIRALLPVPADDRRILFLVDDNIFVKDFHLGECIGVLGQDPKMLGFSLRLGENTTFCYPLNRPQKLPEFTRLSRGLVKFDWTSAEYDFGYPLEVSSSIYRLRDILPLIIGLRFNNPNTLEERMAAHAQVFRPHLPFLGCYRSSVTFCNPVNKVQAVIPNRAGESVQYGVDELTMRFEQGERIHVETYNGFTPHACHQEVELVFEQAGVK